MSIKWILPAIALALCSLTGCPKPAATPNPQAMARGAVETLESAWVATAQACVNVAVANQDAGVLQSCKAVLDPARDSLIAAATAVDSWNAASQANFPCLLKDVVSGLQAEAAALGQQGVVLPQVVTDALALAAPFLPQCVPASDAGVD